MTLINATSHLITLHTDPGKRVIPPSGLIARVERDPEPADPITLDGGAEVQVDWFRPGGRLVWERDGRPVAAPEVADGTDYIVSAQAAAAGAARGDLVAPADLVRDAADTVVGCRRLARPVDARILRGVARHEHDLGHVVTIGPLHVGLRSGGYEVPAATLVAAVQYLVDSDPVGPLPQALALAGLYSRDPDEGHGWVSVDQDGIRTEVWSTREERLVTSDDWDLIWVLIQHQCDAPDEPVEEIRDRVILDGRRNRWEDIGRHCEPADPVGPAPAPCRYCLTEVTWKQAHAGGDGSCAGTLLSQPPPQGWLEQTTWRGTQPAEQPA